MPCILFSDKFLKLYWFLSALFLSIFTSFSPALAMVFSLFFVLFFGNPVRSFTNFISKYLLQLSVIFLGFSLQISTVLDVGLRSLDITFISITLTLVTGFFLGYFFCIDKTLSILISSGTAICGGSAIAAISPSIRASNSFTAISLAIVFILNALALFIFPFIGSYFNLSQEQFGLWSAIAIHDTSSVTAAAEIYGSRALDLAIIVKLTRALWILPLSFILSYLFKSDSKSKFPWFLLGFLLAAFFRSYVPSLSFAWDFLSFCGKKLMIGVLFLIGAGLSRDELKRIGFGALKQGILLWLIVSIVSLIFIMNNWVSLDFVL